MGSKWGNKPEPLAGVRFERWVAKTYVGKNRWRCVCDCGKEKNVLTWNLKSGESKSCGCLQKEVSQALKAKEKQSRAKGKISRNFFTRAKHAANVRNMPFNVTHEELADLAEESKDVCALSGYPISFDWIRPKNGQGEVCPTASLDRVDSQEFYHKPNLQWVHKRVNRAKVDTPEPLFALDCLMVWEHRGKSLIAENIPPDAQEYVPDIHKAIQAVVPGFLSQNSSQPG